MDKNWRPEGWDQIKQNILAETPIIFSPSQGTKDNKDQIMEKAASAILEAYLSERVGEIPTG